MKLSVDALATAHLLFRLLGVAVLLSLISGVIMTVSHRDAVAEAQRLEQVNARRDAASWNAFQVTFAAQKRADDKIAARQAARDKAAADRAARQQAARDKAARAKAARERAERQEAARARAARRQAAREAVIRAREERLAAIREEARQKVAAREAAEARAAQRRADARAARREAARREAGDGRRRSAAQQTSTGHVITGEMTEPDVAGALTARAGGFPGQRYGTLTAPQQKRLRELVRSVERGRTYACPLGSGGPFRDIVAGARVSVRSGTGTLLATTALTGGTVTERGCTFGFTAAVGDADSYQVGVTRRGTVPYTKRALVDNDWRVGLTAVAGQ